MKCATCLHWQAADRAEDEPVACRVAIPMDPDTFRPMVLPFEVRVCRSPKLLRVERPIEASGASVVDASEYYGALLTGPDFGCVNHAAG